MESVSFQKPPPLIGTPKKQNLNKFCDYHGDSGHNTNDCYQLKKQIEEVVASGKLTHLVKDIRQNNQRGKSQRRNNVKVINMIREGGNCKRPFEEERSGLTDELTFPTIPQNQLTDEPIILEGVIEGKAGRSKTVLMEFAIIKCRSPYKVIIGRTGMRILRATPGKGARFMEGDVLQENMEPVVHKRRPIIPDGRLVLKEKVFRWLKEGMIRMVQYLVWVANTIPDNLANGTWKVQVDYSSLNKVCAKDMYPFLEEGEGLASLMGNPYKCFLRLLKEHNQIRMAKDDKEKTSEGRKVSWPYGNKGRTKVPHSRGLNKVQDSRRIWLDEQSRRSPPKDKKEIKQIANTGYSKGRRSSDAISTEKK
ncbi:hypothetical protein Tco_1364775 [Tanacetum coccineum]